MGTSSARPADLNRFAAASRSMDEELKGRATKLESLNTDFNANTQWGGLNAASMLAGFDRYIDLNERDAQWVSRIADDFERAGGEGAISTLPDAAIAASLKAAGLYGGRESITFDDPVAYGMPPTTGYADDPVNTASGNFVELENDLPLTGLASGLRFARTYNSRSDRVGPFGSGWSSWATAHLTPRPEGAEYEGPDGQRALFPRMGAGYGRIAGVDGLVEALPAGLALRWFGGETWEFDDAGRPSRTESGPGTEVRFRHEDGRLVELVHEGGKRVRLEWADERIAALSCSDGRRVDYRYDDGGNLDHVRREAGDRRYDLDEVGRILRVVDADGVVEVDNTYDSEGRVATQLSPFGRRALFHYLPGRVTVNEDDSGGPTNTYIHDQAGRLIGLIDGHGARLTKSYDDWGNPVAVTERNGAVMVREFDERSRVVREVRADGSSFSFLYDDADRVLEVSASNGAVTRYRYEGRERTPAEVVDPEGGVTRMAVAGGLVHRIVDPDGVEVRFEFDADGNIVAAADGEGNRAMIERDPAGRAQAAVSPAGRRTEFGYDPNGRLVQRQDPGGAIWRFEYTAAGRLAAVIDPAGARQETRYGEHGEAQALVDELGHVSTRRYDELGNLVGMSAPDGAKWEMTYDALSRLTGIHDPAGSTWMREYDLTGNLTGTVDPIGTHYTASVDEAGRVTGLDDGLTSASFEFDELGRALAHRRPDGTEMTATYDRCGRRTSVTDPLGGVTRYEYTAAGRVARIVSPSGRTMAFDYDRCGRMAARVDAGGRRIEYRYDADGSLVEVLRPGGEQDRLSYDDAGRLVESITPERGKTSYSYDLAGRITAITTPGGGTRRFSYDPAGRVREVTDANGGVTRYAYNERGWVTEIVDPLGGKMIRRYDEVGRVVAEIDQLGRTTSFGYDPAGRLVERIDGAGLRTRWSYDASGRVTAFGGGAEPEVRVERDALGRPLVIDEPDMRHELGWDRTGRLVERRRDGVAVRWRYDADGYRQALGYPDGSETTYGYDAAGDLTTLSHPAVGTVQLDRDPTGRLTALTSQGIAARWCYEEGKLVGYELEAAGSRRVTQLERDDAGRVVAANVDGATTKFSYDQAGQLVGADKAEGASTFSYDANGRLVEERSPAGKTRYSYDAAGQLSERRVKRAVTSFGYDGAGRRTREVAPEQTRTYTWDDLGRLAGVETSGATGHTSTRVVVDALGELAEVDGTPLMWDSADPLSPLCSLGGDPVVGHGSPWAIVSAQSAQWLEPDWMGTVGAADPWGSDGSSGEPGPRIGHRGEVVLDGLVWLRNRAYDPSTRAFLSPDPIPPMPGTPWAANPYAYAGNDPVGWADPLGLRPVSEAELAKYREQIGRNIFERSADWAKDNWEYIAAGAMVVGGIALMATGVGGPAGVALMAGAGGLMSAGTSVAIQKATTGDVNWGQVAKDGMLGVAAGGAGAGAGLALSSSGRLAATNPALRGAITSGGENLVEGALSRGLAGEDLLNPKAMAGDLLIGGRARSPGGDLGAGRGVVDDVPGRRTDFVAGPIGSEPPVPVSQSRMAAGFDEAGFPKRPTAGAGSPGTEYTLPDGSTVRLMEPSDQAPRRASFENANGQPVDPFTGKPVPNPPGGIEKAGFTKAEWTEYVRSRTHVEQGP